MASNGEMNQVMVDDNLSKVAAGMKAINISLPEPSRYMPGSEGAPQGGSTVELHALEATSEAFALSAERGANIARAETVYAYDESIDKYMCLEGEAYLTSHALIRIDKNDYMPTSKVCLGFYTKSSHLAMAGNGGITHCGNTVAAYRESYTKEKAGLITAFAQGPSIVLVDGPIQAGTYDLTVLDMEGHFARNSITPVFVVKNSDSDTVIKSDRALSDKYHSDLHWAHKTLKEGERSTFFSYQDISNKRITKIGRAHV